MIHLLQSTIHLFLLFCVCSFIQPVSNGSVSHHGAASVRRIPHWLIFSENKMLLGKTWCEQIIRLSVFLLSWS